jgi:hypothetical protein
MSLLCVAVYTWSSVRIHGIKGLTFLYDHYLGLTTAAFIWSVVLATGTYISSFRGEKTPLLAEGGNTGNHIYDVCFQRDTVLMKVVYWKSAQSTHPGSWTCSSNSIVRYQNVC